MTGVTVVAGAVLSPGGEFTAGAVEARCVGGAGVLAAIAVKARLGALVAVVGTSRAIRALCVRI